MSKWRNANCYGYAFNTDDWLQIEGKLKYGYQELMENFPNIKYVSKNEMVLGKRYIAYRYGVDDFHFMVRDEKGHWRHKQGNTPVKPISTKQVFSKQWTNSFTTYNSKIHLFEVIK